MNRIEDELIHKFHIDHECDHKGQSPYRGRAEGFKVKKLQLGGNMSTTDGHSSVVNMYKWAMQQIHYAETLRGNGNKLEATNTVGKVCDKLHLHAEFSEVFSIPYRELLRWSTNCDSGSDDGNSSAGLTAIYDDLKQVADVEIGRLANEKAVSYQKIMRYAASHKNGKIFHRILRKKTETTARPVSKEKMGTTEDQHYAEEQIEVWKNLEGRSGQQACHTGFSQRCG